LAGAVISDVTSAIRGDNFDSSGSELFVVPDQMLIGIAPRADGEDRFVFSEDEGILNFACDAFGDLFILHP